MRRYEVCSPVTDHPGFVTDGLPPCDASAAFPYFGELGFCNYAGVEGNAIAIDEILEHHKLGHLMRFDTIELTEVYVGGEVVLSKIGIVTKSRAGKTSHRMILDTKASNLKGCSIKGQRVLLPRLMDPILHSLNLLSSCPDDEEVEYFVLDFSKAFGRFPSIDGNSASSSQDWKSTRFRSISSFCERHRAPEEPRCRGRGLQLWSCD